MRLELLRHEIALRDPELLVLGVAREVDDVHPVEERAGDRLELVRGADEQDLREVEREVEVVVAEARVLLGVEHLEHRARGLAAEVGAHLVDLVDEEYRVHRLGVAQRADDRAGHRADVGAPVAADLGLVAHAADGDAHELAPQCARDRMAERRLAHPGRADEAEDRARDVVLELRDGEVLDDPLLHLLEVVVVLVEDPLRPAQVEVVRRLLRPGQREDPLEVGADDAVLGGGGRQLLEPAELALGCPPRFLGQQFFDRMKKIALEGGTPLDVGAALCVFLGSSESDGITGKLIAAQWDRWEDWPKHLDELTASDVYTLRRITGRDRNKEWGDR